MLPENDHTAFRVNLRDDDNNNSNDDNLSF